MFSAVIAIVTAIAGSLVYQVIASVVVATLAACWDKWGKDFFTTLCAVICVAGVFYYAASFALLGAWNVGMGDLVVLVVTGIVGWEQISEWVMKAIKWIIGFIADVLKAVGDAVDKAFPWVKPLLIGGAILFGLKTLSDSGTSGSNASAPIYVEGADRKESATEETEGSALAAL